MTGNLFLDWNQLSGETFQRLVSELFLGLVGWLDYCPGPARGQDGGWDGRHVGGWPFLDPNLHGVWMVECKHYRTDAFTRLKSDLAGSKRKPSLLTNAVNEGADLFLLVTPASLTQRQQCELEAMVSGFGLRAVRVLSRASLEPLVRCRPWLLQAYFGQGPSALVPPSRIKPEPDVLPFEERPELTTRLTAAIANKVGPRAVILSGSGGSGKSRFLREGLSRDLRDGRETLHLQVGASGHDAGRHLHALHQGAAGKGRYLIVIDDAEAASDERLIPLATLIANESLDAILLVAVRTGLHARVKVALWESGLHLGDDVALEPVLPVLPVQMDERREWLWRAVESCRLDREVLDNGFDWHGPLVDVLPDEVIDLLTEILDRPVEEPWERSWRHETTFAVIQRIFTTRWGALNDAVWDLVERSLRHEDRQLVANIVRALPDFGDQGGFEGDVELSDRAVQRRVRILELLTEAATSSTLELPVLAALCRVGMRLCAGYPAPLKTAAWALLRAIPGSRDLDLHLALWAPDCVLYERVSEEQLEDQSLEDLLWGQGERWRTAEAERFVAHESIARAVLEESPDAVALAERLVRVSPRDAAFDGSVPPVVWLLVQLEYGRVDALMRDHEQRTRLPPALDRMLERAWLHYASDGFDALLERIGDLHRATRDDVWDVLDAAHVELARGRDVMATLRQAASHPVERVRRMVFARTRFMTQLAPAQRVELMERVLRADPSRSLAREVRGFLHYHQAEVAGADLQTLTQLLSERGAGP